MRGGRSIEPRQVCRERLRGRPPSRGEWKACDVARRPQGDALLAQQRLAAARSRRGRRRRRRRRGPLTAARRDAGREQRRQPGRAGAPPPASPRGGMPASARPRSATRASASSRPITPARQAATYSPTLWPIMAYGSTPQRHPQPGERVLDDEERGLGDAASRRVAPPASSASAPPGRAASRRSRPSCGSRSSAAGVDLAPERRAPLVEAARHAHVLRALAREEEGHRPPARSATPVSTSAAGRALRELPRRVRRSRPTTARRCAKRAGPTRRVYATSASASSGWRAQVRRRGARVRALERRLGAGREHEQLRGPAGPRAGRRRRRLLQHDVGVRAADRRTS